MEIALAGLVLAMQAGLKLVAILLPQIPRYQYYECVPPHTDKIGRYTVVNHDWNLTTEYTQLSPKLPHSLAHCSTRVFPVERFYI